MRCAHWLSAVLLMLAAATTGASDSAKDAAAREAHDAAMASISSANRGSFSMRRSTSKKPKNTEAEYHPNGRLHPRYAHEQHLISGEPDEWFAAILKKEPEDLTLDEVEDMTVDERTDYVGQFIWEGRPETSNTVLHLLRLEQLGRMHNRKQPGEGAHPGGEDDEYSEKHPDHKHAEHGSDGHAEGAVPPEDLHYCNTHWHLEGEKERIEADPVWQRRTKRRRPVLPPKPHIPVTIRHEPDDTASTDADRNETEGDVADVTTASSGATKKRGTKKVAVVPSLESMKDLKASDSPKATTSTLRRKSMAQTMTREERAAWRQKLKDMSEHERHEEVMKHDQARCMSDASSFCEGLMYDFAGFVDCVLNNTHLFEPHNDYCEADVQFYAPCRADMLEHCPKMTSAELIRCMVRLAQDQKTAFEAGDTPSVVLTDTCMQSEHLEVMIDSDPFNQPPDEHAMTPKLQKTLYKYQQFWLSQHDDPTTDEDDYVDPKEHADQFDIRIDGEDADL